MLSYEAELNIFRSILRQFNLSINIIPLEGPALFEGFNTLRWQQTKPEYVHDLAATLKSSLLENTIYHITDEFTCHYSILILPEYTEKTILAVGPYVDSEKDMEWIQSFAEDRGIHNQWLPIIESYFRDVPCLSSDKVLSAALNSLGERIWGVQKFSSQEIIRGLPESFVPLTQAPEPQIQDNVIHNIKKIEAQYSAENQFIQAVSQGRSHRVSVMLSNFSKGSLESRTEPIRNIKNYSIILNTLMRKAAEQGGVHPMHIDRLSSEFARRIETTALWDQIMELWQEMGKKYCLLVKNHSIKNYSQLVQHIIARIDYDLTADLSLKANAEALNVNPSYLSTLFKKETGSTLTDYVNRKRIEHAIYLLNTTDLPISVVGQRCGIQDDNYFTKIFKKYIGMTPKQFRLEKRQIIK